MMKRRIRPHPNRRDVLRRIDRLFPERERAEALEAIDLLTHPDDCDRARLQLMVLERSGGSLERVRELATHQLMESVQVQAAPDPETRRNEGYAG